MSPMRRPRPPVGEPLTCDEFGHGLGRTDGILVLRYRGDGPRAFAAARQAFRHQLYWAPGGLLAATWGGSPVFLGEGEAFWARRAVEHEVYAPDRPVAYRLCLREIPPTLEGMAVGGVRLDATAQRLVVGLARRGIEPERALADRARLLAGLHPAEDLQDRTVRAPGGRGYALTVARTLARDPADPTDLAGWAERLHISPKTLQRDVERSFGMSWTRWRTRVRLQAARALLVTHPVGVTALRVGYASPSAFVAAFTREYGRTPGRGVDRPARPEVPA